ncbi:aspartate ammonia-lyase [Neptunomonas sp. XY-337]|uniref:aspartate ammonia-lyase n=1 Tax=Neptunomonas sp. XY-337 TaxID=2561897 RepID=UPI0010AA8CC0|nr:aspartate ammonia-lyase [Neptunomonas sp. XY-337]
MRIEHDALGERKLDKSLSYGIQTLRAKENFAISGKTIAHIPDFVASIVQIKHAAAIANNRAGVLDQSVSDAIGKAASDTLKDLSPRDFVVDIYHGGGGTSANMNVNEVLANRANEIATGHKGYDFVHPNTHVNMGQSTNDVIPAAMKMTVYQRLTKLENALGGFIHSLDKKESEFNEIVKLGRTCLQDALPITLGQQFSGYKSAFERMLVDVQDVKSVCLELPLSATAIGTEFGTFPGYKEGLYKALCELTGVEWGIEHNLFDGLQNADLWLKVSAVTKAVALNLHKLSGDLRLMSSGPRAGLEEISLPAVQPGSSIMPGKVNPVMPEMAMQVYFRVLGNDVAISRACEGELDLNVWESLILNCVTESCELLTECMPLLAKKCIDGIVANSEKCFKDAEQSLALSTVIATLFDYQTASKLAKQADLENKTIKQVVIENKVMSEEDAGRYLDPLMMTSPDRFNELFNSKRGS